jgi:hypothetical protein
MPGDSMMIYAMFLLILEEVKRARQARQSRKARDNRPKRGAALVSCLQALYARLRYWLRELFHRLTLR